MSDIDEDEFEAEGNEADEKKNPLRPVLKQKEKELRDALAELREFRAEKRTGTVAELIKAAGGDPRYAKFYTSDDSSEDAVKAWIQSESELLGVQSKDDPDPQEDQVRSLQNAVNSAPKVKLGSQQELIDRINSAKTREEYDAAVSAAFKAS